MGQNLGAIDMDETNNGNGHPTDSNPTRLALRPAEAAESLGISPRKLWQITADCTSRIPHVRFGKALIYPIAELRCWLAERTSGKKSP